MNTDDLIEIGPGVGSSWERRRETDASSLPIRWSGDGVDEGAVIRGVDDDMRGGHRVEPGTLGTEPEPSASVRGWVSGDGSPRGDALFVLAGSVLGVSREDQERPPLWLALGLVRSLDAIGDPVDGDQGGVQEVELRMDDGTVLRAGWTLSFCDEVVSTLQRVVERETAASRPGAAERSGPDVQFEEITDARPPSVEPRPADRRPSSPLPPGASGPPGSSGPIGPSAGAVSSPAPVTRPDPPEPPPPGTPPVGRQAVPAAPGAFGRSPERAGVDGRPSFSTGPTQRGVAVPPTRPATATAGVVAPATAPAPTNAPAPAPANPAPTDAAPTSGPVESRSGAPTDPRPPQPTEPRTAPASATQPGTLELEDVVYLGGYPGHGKKRKKCTATLGRAGLDVSGPSDLHFRISWDVVRTIEIQNSDEARFRMNAKIHRDASALVVECDQGVTILLEARDCPTIALRAAIGQLLDDVPVVVV